MNQLFLSQVGTDQRVCLSSCVDQVNSVSVTSSDFPNRETFVRRDEFCLTLTKLQRTCSSEKRAFLVAKFPSVCGNINKYVIAEIMWPTLTSYSFVAFLEIPGYMPFFKFGNLCRSLR